MQAKVDDGLALFLKHGSVQLHSSPVLFDAAKAATSLLHFDESRVDAFLGSCSDDDKIDGLPQNTVATHHMIGRLEYFFGLNSMIRGSIRFDDASAVEIVGAGSVIFVAKTDEH